jgi:DNA-binding NtrC family response regulator
MNLLPDQSAALIVDDDPFMIDIITEVLESQNITVTPAVSVTSARQILAATAPDLLVTDLNLPDGDGLDVIEHCRAMCAHTAIVVLTGFPDEKRVRDMMALDISTFLVKPFTLQQLQFAVIRALEERKVRLAEESEDSGENGGGQEFGLIGNSSYINRLRKSIRIMSEGDFPVLINGASGTGKEIVAKAIHQNSNRSAERMVTINCAAIPHHLEESEFFGYAKGAFTDARTAKHGILECADRSTLFLDEIGELSLSVQAKLLRVLDTGEFIRIGEVHPRKVDIRILSATNRNLEEMVASSSFRADLYFRLKGAMITTEPLSTHPEDIPALSRYFITEFDIGKQLTQGAMERLQRYNWQGNIRELKNTLQYMITRSRNHHRVTAEMVESVLGVPKDTEHAPQPFSKVKEQFERDYFISLLRLHGGNISRVAREAEIHRPNLLRKLKELGIRPETYRNSSTSTLSIV